MDEFWMGVVFGAALIGIPMIYFHISSTKQLTAIAKSALDDLGAQAKKALDDLAKSVLEKK